MTQTSSPQDDAASMLYHVNLNDSKSQLFDRSGMDDAVVTHISELMASLGRLRAAERKLAEASQRFMSLNETDMRALHFLIVAEERDLVTTPSAIANHLGISGASTTKLLDRLEKAGHIARHPHPSDRRALAITIAPRTREAARNSVGRQQARRFYAAARLSPAERDVVIGFLDDMTRELGVGADWSEPAEPA